MFYKLMFCAFININGTRSFDILQDLHWLPIDQRIEFKLATLTYNILNSSQPA